MKPVKVIILGGGVGKRFWPIKTDKFMIQMLGKSLLEHNLQMLKNAGFLDIVLVLPKEAQEKNKPSISGMNIQIVIQSNPEGMGDAVLQAQEQADGFSWLIMNASDMVDSSLFQQLKKEMKDDRLFVVGKKVDEYFDGGYLKFNGEKLTDVIEKPGKDDVPSDLVNLVFHFFPEPKKLIEALQTVKGTKDDAYEIALSHLLKQTDATAFKYSGFWQAMKYPWHVLDMMDHFLEQCPSYKGKNVQLKSNVVIEGPVYMGNNVRIFENTKIVGPVYIGDNSIIGNNNIIRHSHIGKGCVTGFNTDITRSYIGDACWFHSNYIGDSVIEQDVSFGSGSVLANLRLDEGMIFSTLQGKRVNTMRNKLGAIIGSDVRIGVNVNVMPGIKIGNHSFVGAGTILDKDIEDNSFCVSKPTYIIKKNHHENFQGREEFKKKI